MLTPQQEQMLALQAMLEEQNQPSPELVGLGVGTAAAAGGAGLGRLSNAAINLGRRARGKKPMGMFRAMKRPAGLALGAFALGGGAGYGVQSQINNTVPAAEAIAKAAMGQPLNSRDEQLLANALAQAYSNQGQMMQSGII
tara:strand:+ start:144 stop:566 length:423 start_codon:yes stop_codon:yes gene_type:complete